MMTPEESEALTDEEFLEMIPGLTDEELSEYLDHYETKTLSHPDCTPEIAADVYSVREMIENMKRDRGE